MKRAFVLILCGVAFIFASCNRNKQQQGNTIENTTTSGVITICVDETLKPIIEEEIEVFEGLYPKANIIPKYTSEVTAFNELFADSVKLIVATRSLTDEEIQSLQANNLYPKVSKIAIDGVALITNRNNPDSLVTLDQLRDIFTGKITKWNQLNPKSRMGDLEVVFDNTNSSTVRYVIENINKGQELTGNIKATHDNEGVIDYVLSARTGSAIKATRPTFRLMISYKSCLSAPILLHSTGIAINHSKPTSPCKYTR